MLGLLGGSLGVLGALALVPLLVALSPSEVPRLADATLDATTLAVALALDARRRGRNRARADPAGRRRSLREALQGGSRSLAAGGSRLRPALVACEVALALVLLVGAGLLLRSFVALRDAPLGFDATHLLAFDAGASEKRSPGLAQQRRYFEELLGGSRALPGVESVAAVTLRPLWGTVGMDWPFTVEGQSAKDAERNPLLNFETVTPDYFRTMGIPLVARTRLRRARPRRPAGRRDRERRARAPLLARTGPDRQAAQDPAASDRNTTSAWLTVVGVAGDARYRELTATRLDLYMPELQSDHRPQHVVVRTRRRDDRRTHLDPRHAPRARPRAAGAAHRRDD